MLNRFTHAEVLARVIVDEADGLMSIEAGGGNDELGHVEGEETVAIETARVALWQHESLRDNTVGVDVTEIRTGEEAVVTTGAEHEPAGVRAPVVERFGVVGVCPSHRTGNACSQIEQVEVGLVMPDAELSVVGERVAEETPVVGGTGEGYGGATPGNPKSFPLALWRGG